MKRTVVLASLLALVLPLGARASGDSSLRSLRESCAAGNCVLDEAALRPATNTPTDWLRTAARVQGLDVAAPRLGRTDLRTALRAFYAELRYALDLSLQRRIDATAALPAEEQASTARIVSSATEALRLAARATQGAALPTDIRRAMELVTLSSSPWLMTPALHAEFDALLAELSKVDMTLMVRAGLALTSLPGPDPLPEQLDLPFISIGNDGDTTYTGDLIISIDRSGNDTYLNNAGGALLQTAGGSLAIDYGDGADRYEAATRAQGFGEGAAGLLYDEGGSDFYSGGTFSQGASFAGVGILYDEGDGSDTYISPQIGDAQPIGDKASSLGGIGILVDEGGSDSFHQDGLDGFSYGAAGGLGYLASLGEGDDVYRSDELPISLLGLELGTFAGPVQNSSEVNATAILYDESGDDTYICGAHVRQGCQASAGPGSVAILWEEAGNDTYWMGETISPVLFGGGISPVTIPAFPMGQGIAYGVGVPAAGLAIGLLYDESGSDSYSAQKWAQGYGIPGGLGVLRDLGGSQDTYATASPLVGARADGSTWADGSAGAGEDD